MEIEKIQKLYENVPLSNLTEREKELVNLLFPPSDEKFLSKLPNGRFRILQFDTHNFAQLTHTLELVVPDLCLFDRQNQLAVEQFSGENLTHSELQEVFQTLAQDLQQEIFVHIGMFAEKNELSSLYQEERRIFESRQSFSEYILARNLAQDKNKILQRIRELLRSNPDDQKLVQALYASLGNQAQAAKILYVHRNTLLNKIKKYEQKYGLQLTGSDLVLAYNLL